MVVRHALTPYLPYPLTHLLTQNRPDIRKDFQENTHDHRWAFASTMILGAYRTQILQRKQDIKSVEPYNLTEKLFHFVYESANAHIGGSNYEIKPINPSEPDVIQDYIFSHALTHSLSHSH